MRKTGKFLLLLALLALIPLRAVAAVSIGYCAMAAHHDPVSSAVPQAPAAEEIAGAQHDAPASESFSSGTCPEHSSFGLFVAPASSAPAGAFTEARITSAHRTLTAFIPLLPERPPLA